MNRATASGRRFATVTSRWASCHKAWLAVVLLGLSLLIPFGLANASSGEPPFVLGWSSFESDEATSVAWGDYDGDGDLDLAIGQYSPFPNRLYRNDGGILTADAVWSAPEWSDQTTSLAWGDYDGDGDLDLAVGNDAQPNRIYRNDGVSPSGAPLFTLAYSSVEADGTSSVAWGDYDGDGDLDLAVGNGDPHRHLPGPQPVRLYRNGGVAPNGTPIFTLAWSAPTADRTTSVAWGDCDGDGDLDLAVGNEWESNQVYRNDRALPDGTPVFILAWNSTDGGGSSVAWGDYDTDGDLDLASSGKLYRNNQGVLTNLASWTARDGGGSTAAWGDYDGDGDLDLVMSNRLYRNDVGILTNNAVWTVPVPDSVQSVAWGDCDGDGDLDLAIGNWGAPSRLYLSEGSGLIKGIAWAAPQGDSTTSTAWGDYDRDGDLDLVIGTDGQPNRLYPNHAGVLSFDAIWSSSETDDTNSVAWGDYDGDGDLDLAVGNFAHPNRLYRNDEGVLTISAVWSSPGYGRTESVAWGDYDGDGDLDLAVGRNDPNQLYRNDGIALDGTPVFTVAWSSAEWNHTETVAWGDYDGDGDLDLAVGNRWGPNRLYRNEGGTLTAAAVWESAETDHTRGLAWGDYDGDGDLDLAVGNVVQPNRLYRNDGGVLGVNAIWTSVEADWTESAAWGDYDGDGDPDLTTSKRLYRNDGGRLISTAVMSFDGGGHVAWGDYDSDGDLDLTVGNRLYANTRNTRARVGLPGSAASLVVRLARPAPPGDAGFYSAPNVWPAAGATIPISYTVSQPDSRPVSYIRAYYSLDGGGRWLPAVATSGTVTTNLATSPTGLSHLYTWDVLASGFFGQSDNVVFRIVAVPDLRSVANSVPGPYLYGSNASDTYPFRVRGTQLRVMEANSPVRNALVYRLPAVQAQAGALMTDRTGQPYKTDGAGYLQGRGTIGIGDRLLALAPITATAAYTMYHTNGTPTLAGLDIDIVQGPGVQTLVVSPANPLLSFNLNVSLEWDASNEPAFLARLQADLIKAARALYDWTNGQVALGRVTITQAKERWAEADVQVLASNQVRPNSARGGIVSETTTVPLSPTLTVAPGTVRIGPTWNRYGQVETIGEDWPRVLAHELAHYALFLEDTYIGLDDSGLLVPISTCGGTAMSDPYSAAGSEFRYADGAWDAECGASLAEEPEWDILAQVYPALHAPPPTNGGPNSMPFALTQIEIKEPPAGAAPLDDTNVQLDDPDLKLAGGRAFLVQPGVRIVDLGRPVGGAVLARGAREEDELCIFVADWFDCKPLSNVAPTLLAPRAAWRPQITVTPVNKTTLRIKTGDLDGAAGLTLTVYPGGEAFTEVTLQPMQTREIVLGQPATDVLLDFSGDNDNQRLVSGYWLGSGPGRTYSYGGPYASTDGGVSVYPPENLTTDDFMVLQTPLVMPHLPPGRVQIGRAYEIRAGSGAAVFTGGSVSFQYLGLDVLLSGIPEQYLKVYTWDGSVWQPLRTVLSTAQNFASAPLPRPGIYALLAGTEIPLTGPGWNHFGYTIQETLPVTVALRSIEGAYTTVYGYDPADPDGDPWKIYSVGVPVWVNELQQLEYAHGYWIQATAAITLYLGGGSAGAAASPANLPYPPATYYGAVLPGRGFVPAAGMPVKAYVNGHLCGRSKTRQRDGQIVYAVDVDAGGGDVDNCGAVGRPVQFEVGGQRMNVSTYWDNNYVHKLMLYRDFPPNSLYLPVLVR